MDGNKEVGTLVINQNYYELKIGTKSYALYMEHELSGKWAMRGMYDVFTILYQDTDGYVHAKFRGVTVKMSYYDTSVLTFNYMEGKIPFTYYVHLLPDAQSKETVLILTEYATLSGDDYIYCSRLSDMFGTWRWNKDREMTLTFDGVSDAYAEFYSGVAKQSRSGYDTDYYYTVKDGKIVLYSQTALQGQILYYDIKVLSENDEGYAEAKSNPNNWVGDNGTVIVRTKVDSLYLSNATDADENKYFFDFLVKDGVTLGAIRVNGEIKYTYVMDDVMYNNTTRQATMVVTDVENNKVYNATLDYSNADGDVFILGEEVTE